MVPLTTAPVGEVQEPPGCGAPPNELNRLVGAFEEQRLSDELPPGLEAATMLIVTVALALGQGGVPGMVYVYAPGPLMAGLNTPPNGLPPGSVHVPPA